MAREKAGVAEEDERQEVLLATVAAVAMVAVVAMALVMAGVVTAEERLAAVMAPGVMALAVGVVTEEVMEEVEARLVVEAKVTAPMGVARLVATSAVLVVAEMTVTARRAAAEKEAGLVVVERSVAKMVEGVSAVGGAVAVGMAEAVPTAVREGMMVAGARAAVVRVAVVRVVACWVVAAPGMEARVEPRAASEVAGVGATGRLVEESPPRPPT